MELLPIVRHHRATRQVSFATLALFVGMLITIRLAIARHVRLARFHCERQITTSLGNSQPTYSNAGSACNTPTWRS